jgi:hypothetical protein
MWTWGATGGRTSLTMGEPRTPRMRGTAAPVKHTTKCCCLTARQDHPMIDGVVFFPCALPVQQPAECPGEGLLHPSWQ